MKIVVFVFPETQARGLLAYQPIPKDTLFLFPHIKSTVLTTVGLNEAIRVVFLDSRMMPVAILTPVEAVVFPGTNMPIPHDVKHVVEAGVHTPILPHLKAIRFRIKDSAGDSANVIAD